MNRASLWAFGLALVCAGGAAAHADDAAIDRALTLRRHGALITPRPGAGLALQGRPADYLPRDFPAVLRDPRLSEEPDGILWRRLRSREPGLDLRAEMAPSLAHLRQRLEGAMLAQPDTVRILAIRVDFLKDSAEEESTTPDGRFDLRPADSVDVIVDPPPHDARFFASHMEALKRYYWKQSGGQLVVEWDIYPEEPDSAYHLSDTADYGPWIVSSQDDYILNLAERLVRDAYAAADTDTAAAPPDFRRYESFWLIHAGADFQGDINRDTNYDIPSFNLYLADPVALQDSTFFVDLILVVPETVSQDGFTGALNGVLTHEFGHQLGFFDLYDPLTFFPMVGMFSLMDSGDNLYGTVWDSVNQQEVFVRGAIPASVDPWHKLLFFPGGVQATWVTGDQEELEVPAVQTGNELLLVPIGGQGVADYPDLAVALASEYYVVENRPFDLNGDGTVILQSDPETGVFLGPVNADVEPGGRVVDRWGEYEQDYLLPGGGVLIWHVDNAAIRAASNVCYGCINLVGQRRGVDIEEADGIDDLGDLYSVEWTGGSYDYWFQGGYTDFGPESRPSSASGAGARTGIGIAVLDSAQVSMRVQVSRGLIREGWPRYLGSPLGAGAVNAVDLDGDDQAEIVGVGGRYVMTLRPSGSAYPYAQSGDGLFAETDSVLLPGIAVQTDFLDGYGERGTLIAAASATRVWGWDAHGQRVLRYPSGEAVLPTLRFTTPPLAHDSLVVIGDSEGRLRGLMPKASNEMLWRTAEAGYPIHQIATGDLFGDGRWALAWGDAHGRLFVGTGSVWEGTTPAPGWPVQHAREGSAIEALLVIEEERGLPGMLLAASADGRVALYGPDGEPQPGWPREMGAAPVGLPVAGDPDGDGVLDFALTGADGRVHLFMANGEQVRHWPRSVWHPDLGAIGPMLCGPILADVTGDGRPELLQGSGDGSVHAFTVGGEEVDGWPLAIGHAVAAGPQLAPLGEDGALELLAADAGGFATICELGLAARAVRPGECWRGDGGPARWQRVAREQRPVPAGYAGLLDAGSLAFTPNPVLGATGMLRARMGGPGRLRLQLFDTSGHEVWDREHPVAGGAEELVWPLDLAEVAPGLYVARITATGEGGGEMRLLRKLAIVR